MQNKCECCKNVYYDYFCSYKARWCKIHGCIDCNPDSYLNTLKEKECPDFSFYKGEVVNNAKKSYKTAR